MGRNIKQKVRKLIAVKRTQSSLRQKTCKSYPRGPEVTTTSGKPQSSSMPEIENQGGATACPAGERERPGETSGSFYTLTWILA